LGSFVAPGIGTAIGSKLGSLAGGLFEIPGEMPQEQAQFEVARRVVRLAAASARNAAAARPAPTINPRTVARAAIARAARQVAGQSGAFRASWLLEQEARALLTRLDGVKPFVLQETMVPAAALMPAAQVAIDRYLMRGRRELRAEVLAFLRWLAGSGRAA